MKEDKKSAFTLVELIIGVFIIVILGFIGATSYLQKVDTLRDSARVATVGEIYGAMDVYKLKENLPLGGQDKMIEIYSSGTLVGYQGDIDETLLQTIGYNGKGVDPKSDEPYTFLYTRNKQNAQILLFLENNDSAQKFNSQLFGEEASANEIIPFVFGKKLGVYTDMNKQPIQRTLGNATFDITTATESYNSHYAGDTYSTGTGAFLKKNTYVLTQGGLQYTSCLDALDSDASLRNKNGVYTIEDQNRQPQSVYCDMTREGGGWSLVLKADGTLDTFQYSESIWENTNTLNPENYSYDHQEFKSELFSTQSFSEMMIELDTAGDKRTLIVPTSANSMHELMNAGANYLTKSDLSIIGKESWKDLVPGSSLQKNCWNGGINMGKDLDRAWIRIGLVTDNSPENTGGICPTPNSYIGIGGKNDEFPTLDLSVGNYGKGHGNYEDGEKSIASFGYVFIR